MPLLLTRRSEPRDGLARVEFDIDAYPGRPEIRGDRVLVNPGVGDGEELRDACVTAMEAALCGGFEGVYFGAKDSVLAPDALTDAVKAAAENFLEAGLLTIYLHSEETASPPEEVSEGLLARIRRFWRRRLAPAEEPEASPADADPFRSRLEESFSRALLRRIDEKGLTDGACCRRANVERRLLTRLRADDRFLPGKTEAAAFAVALELSAEEARELLEKAGYALSRSILFDVIVERCLRERQYDVTAVNALLFRYGQPQLGSGVPAEETE